MSCKVVLRTMGMACAVLLAVGCQRPPSGTQQETSTPAGATVDAADTGAAGQAQPVPEPEAVPEGAAGEMVTPETGEAIATFTARGNEPFWSVQVEGGSLTYATPELQPGRHMRAERTAHAQGVQFTGHDEGRAFTLDIRGVPCEDTMSGEPFEFTATFKYGDETFTGCARRGL